MNVGSIFSVGFIKIFFTSLILTVGGGDPFIPNQHTFTLPSSYGLDIHNAALFISHHCPELSQDAINSGLTAYHNAKALGLDVRDVLTIVDYTQPSNVKRLCSVDLAVNNVLFNDFVAHGKASGQRYATQFSNEIGGNETSLGLYVTGQPYYGIAGKSLTLYGLDKGINDNARARHVVMHGSRHVSDKIAKARSSVGRTLGCFGLSNSVSGNMIDKLKGGTLLFAYYPSKQLLDHSVFLKNSLVKA